MSSKNIESAKKTSKKRHKSEKKDRFPWVLTISVVFHLVIVLGVSFVLPSEAKNRDFSPPLKITLVPTASDLIDEDASVLAQNNSIGEEEGSLPTISQSLPGAAVSGSEAEQREQLLLQEQAKALFDPAVNAEAEGNPTTQSDREALTESINLAFLNSQAKPRERFVSANAKASEIAPYLENWRLLVERVGNLNYPDAAKIGKIEGDLVMDVSIRADGSVNNVRILRSSGHKILDDGAERIVFMAAPFEAFSDEMKRDYDTLHIVRTWRFSQNRVTDVTR